jgi:hypothetical protein
MTGFNFDVIGKLITELRADADVTALNSTRIRGFEPAPGDAKGAGSYQNFVVLVLLDAAREKRIPVQRPRIALRCYGTTPQQAMANYAACSNALHNAGVRTYSNGLGIWNSFDDAGASADRDPDTDQPLVTFVLDLAATTVAVE